MIFFLFASRKIYIIITNKQLLHIILLCDNLKKDKL